MAQWVALHKTLDPRTKEIEKSYERNVNQRRKDVVQNALKSGYLKVIDKELILTAQEEEAQGRCKNLSEVLRISLPRWHIQLLDSAALSECTLLTICNLSSCYVRDITAFRSCASLLKLDLSNNQVSFRLRLPCDNNTASRMFCFKSYMYMFVSDSRSPRDFILVLAFKPASTVPTRECHQRQGMCWQD